MLVVHIGLGKTATSSLQKYVFPHLAEIDPDICYNDQVLIDIFYKHHLFGASRQELKVAHDRIEAKNNFISSETLVNWDPHRWEEAADKNLELFGRSSIIVITVRDPISYITSVYQQKIHEGNIKHPEDFFISNEEYRNISSISHMRKLPYLDTSKFDLAALNDIYRKRFEKVYFVPTSFIHEFKFLRDSFNLSDESMEILRTLFKTSPPENIAYSNLAMRLSFLREKILNKFGVKSIGTEDIPPLHVYRQAKARREDEKCDILFRDLCLKRKIRQAPGRLSRRIAPILRWDFLMRGIINKYMPYNKYTLPDNLKIDYEMLKNSEQYIQQIEKSLTDV